MAYGYTFTGQVQAIATYQGYGMTWNQLCVGVQAGTVTAALGGAGALAKSGSGIVTLSAANPYSGGTSLNAGTLKVVPVRNSIQTIPAMAPGNAVMMMNGSSQLWKLTTSRK